MFTIPKREKKPNLNKLYGLEYRQIAVRREDVDKLHFLKEQSGQPISTLVGMAIEQFLHSAQIES